MSVENLVLRTFNSFMTYSIYKFHQYTDSISRFIRRFEENDGQNDDAGQKLKKGALSVGIVNLVYTLYIAVLIGIVQGWEYAIHCFFLAVFLGVCFVVSLKAKKKEVVKFACWSSCTCLITVLMTSFTLLTRPSYYRPADTFPHKWSVFSLQAAIIPLLLGVMVLYELNVKKIHHDRMIIMITVLDFADTWDMAHMMSKNKQPFIDEQSDYEVLIQFFCSTSFIFFSLIMWKIMKEDVIDDGVRSRRCLDFCSKFFFFSQIYKNFPFFLIRMLVLFQYHFVDFEFVAKNVISFLLSIFDGLNCTCMSPTSAD